ncbi:hypothetical protein AVEN_36284-1 [Araneus ventricosus]|uniref:Uncharacterized protein n=1 Tax=Araneus ventricosus TaxID=182803 RepID=A0A4Y2QFZ8_ARAVE|nr:hypothetical protein AVEN_183101-1 [Araneus ventricosus]GBN62237.1 hypothetical protein AVEN_75344-1 [Araneus ventricosus]GBN62412.1 hypothetical protein AVEN_106066-1 [Araneus ventricosus]GBN62426.1 hypothetical protein AVEN_36284-1 [Araneus ventricosus]
MHKKSILLLNAISGCDTTSGLYGKGKLQAVQLFNLSKYLYDIPEIFNNPKSTYNEIERAGERFIIALYSNTKKEESSLNKMSNCTAIYSVGTHSTQNFMLYDFYLTIFNTKCVRLKKSRKN